MGSTETELGRRLVLEPLRKQFPGSMWTKIPGSSFSVGLPDVIGIVQGRTVWIELKKESNNHGRPTAIQEANLRAAALAGAAALVFVFGLRGRRWTVVDVKVYLESGEARPCKVNEEGGKILIYHF